MNPAVFAATTATTSALAAGQARRAQLVKRLQALPRAEATRERVLDGQPELAAVLEQLQKEGLVHARPDGTLRFDLERQREAARRVAKVALVVACALVLVAASAGTMLVLAR